MHLNRSKLFKICLEKIKFGKMPIFKRNLLNLFFALFFYSSRNTKMGSDKVIIVSGKTEGGANAKQHQTTPKFNGNKKRGNRSKSSVEPEEYLSWRKPASNQVTPTSVNTSPIVPSSSTINKKRDEKNFPENRRNSTGNNNKNQSTNNGNKRETKNKKKKTKSESSVLRPNEANGTIVSAQFSSTPKKMPIKMIANLPSSKKCDSM